MLFAGAVSAGSPSNVLRVAGYVPTWTIERVSEESLEALTDLLIFSVVPTSDGAWPTQPIAADAIRWYQNVAEDHDIRLHLCVGGWGRSDGFAAMTATEDKRHNFIRDIVAYCRELGIEGIDYDWEFPANAEEQAAYVELLQDTRAATRAHDMTVSVAIGTSQVLPRRGVAAVDHVNAMTYDMPGKHATFEGAQSAVRRFLRMGVPARKLWLGLPFYGRGIEARDTTMSYAEIVRQHAPSSDVNEADGLYFNGPDLIRQKVQFAREQALGGVMVWEVSADATGAPSLLNAIAQALE